MKNSTSLLLFLAMIVVLCRPLYAAPPAPPVPPATGATADPAAPAAPGGTAVPAAPSVTVLVPEKFNMSASSGKKMGRGKSKTEPLSPDDYLSPSAPLTPRERQTLQMARDWENSAPPAIQANGKIMFVFRVATPTVICAPYQLSDVELQAGEVVNEAVPADSVRWSMELVKSGDTPHILIKPIDAGLATSAFITTNRRSYYLNLKSEKIDFTPRIGFLYPDENSAKLKESLAANRPKPQEADGSPADLSKLNFTYEIKGDTPWKPVQVFDDGRQMFIKFPDQIQSGDAPILLVRNNGQDTMANSRMKHLTMIVDGVFPEAILISGVGSKQQRITIRKK